MGETARQPVRMTFEEAAALDPDEHTGELDRGEWIPVTRNTWRHGEVVGNVTFLLKLWARAHPGWTLSAGDPGTKLSRNPDVLRGPDVAVARADRKPTGRGAEGWLEGAPDLVVEVFGDAQPAAALMQKAIEYLAAGARLVWLVDPDAERVVVMTPPDHARVAGAAGELDGGDALPGLRVPVTEIFAR